MLCIEDPISQVYTGTVVVINSCKARSALSQSYKIKDR